MNGLPFSNTSTSMEAARAAAPKASEKAGQVYELLRRREHMHRGLTADEIEVAARMHSNTVTARVRGLVLEGWVYDSGQKRPTRTGRNAVVWLARDRPVPPTEARPKQTHGRLAAAVRHERARVLLEFTRLADEIVKDAEKWVGMESRVINGATVYAIEKIKADALRKAVGVVDARLGQ